MSNANFRDVEGIAQRRPPARSCTPRKCDGHATLARFGKSSHRLARQGKNNFEALRCCAVHTRYLVSVKQFLLVYISPHAIFLLITTALEPSVSSSIRFKCLQFQVPNTAARQSLTSSLVESGYVHFRTETCLRINNIGIRFYSRSHLKFLKKRKVCYRWSKY
jgi:hypothetical protein